MLAKKLTNAGEGTYGNGARLLTAEGLYPFIYQNGGDILLDNKTKIGYSMQKRNKDYQLYADLNFKRESFSNSRAIWLKIKLFHILNLAKVGMAMFGSWMTGRICRQMKIYF